MNFLKLAPVAAASIVTSGVFAPAALAAPGDTLVEATQRGANYLRSDVVRFEDGANCQACHRQGAAVLGLAEAFSNGYSVDTGESRGLGYLAREIVRYQGAWGAPSGTWWHTNRRYRNDTHSYSGFGLAGYDRYVSTRYSTDLVEGADDALAHQQSNGRVPHNHGNYPTSWGHISTTARYMFIWSQAQRRADPSRAARYQTALDRAEGYIRANARNYSTSVDGLGRTFQAAWAILGLKENDVENSDGDLAAIRSRLLNTYSTRNGRGWGYTTSHNVDEFNTGLALYALCKAGETLSTPAVSNAANWLNNRQQSSGRWDSPTHRSHDIPTTFAMLGLGCFGTLGVDLGVTGDRRVRVSSNVNNAQTVTFTINVRNTGAFGGNDTYSLSVNGGLPGWTANLSTQSLTIAAGSSASVTLTVTTGTNLPAALPVDFSVRATSQSSASVSETTSVTVYTDPPPPVAGLDTSVSITGGNGSPVTTRLQPRTLSAQVRDQTGTLVRGPASGVVTFYVAGNPVANDTDSDGDGTFQADWTPGSGWAANGVQDFRAIYSGIDRPSGSDLLSSLASTTITLDLGRDTDSDGLEDDLETAVVGTDPTVADTDGDGCLDGAEWNDMQTNPLVTDTDGDGVGDCTEANLGTDPTRDDSFPDEDEDGISDASDPFPCDPAKSSVAFIPGEGEYGQLLFEDNWPSQGDLDFNDGVIAYNYKLFRNSDGLVTGFVLTVEPLALGATLSNGIALSLPVSSSALSSATRTIGGNATSLGVRDGESELVVVLAEDARALFGNRSGLINAEASAPMVDAAQVEIRMTFSTPFALSLGDEPFDLFFFRSSAYGHQIHRPGYDGTDQMDRGLFGTADDGSTDGRWFVDSAGLPFVLALPELAPWPEEYQPISNLFPNITTFASTSGAQAQDFYSSQVVSSAAYTPSLGLAVQSGGVIDQVPAVVYDRSCTSIPFGGN